MLFRRCITTYSFLFAHIRVIAGRAKWLNLSELMPKNMLKQKYIGQTIIVFTDMALMNCFQFLVIYNPKMLLHGNFDFLGNDPLGILDTLPFNRFVFKHCVSLYITCSF